MKNRIRSVFVVLMTSFVFYACTDDYFEFDKIKTDEWRPEMAFPAVSSSLTLEDIVVKKDSNNLIQTNSDGVLEIIYDGSVFANIGGQFIDLPNQNINDGFTLPQSFLDNLPATNPVPPGVPPVTHTETISIPFNTTIEIDSVLFKGGSLVFNMRSYFQHNIDVNVSFPNIRDANGQPLSFNTNLPASDGTTPTQRSPFPVPSLEGYTMDLTGNNGINANITMTFQFIGGNNLSANDRFEIVGEIRNMDFKEFEGYIGTQTLNLKRDTIDIGMFKNFKSGEFFISNPTLEIDIRNSFGLPSRLKFNSLEAINPDKAEKKLDIQLPPDSATGLSNEVTLKYPDQKGTRITRLPLDKVVSNIDSIISFLLKEIRYESEVKFNPANDNTQRNFFTDSSGIGLDIFLKIPFEGRAKDFFLVDTIPMDLSITSDLESGTIRTIANNGFPVDVTMQMVFTDSLYNPIDSLYPQGAEAIIPAAPIDGNGDAVGTTKGITDTGITLERFNKLSDGRFALLIAKLNTQDAELGKNVRFKPGYKLGIDVSIRAKVIVD